MSKIVAIGKPGLLAAGSGPPVRRPLTPIWPLQRVATNVRPVSDPWIKQRPEGWDMFSRDGLWHYERYETGKGTNWRAIFIPTGQHVDDFPNRNDARAATAAGLQDRLASGAFALALRSRLDDPQRAQGQRWLAIHMRVAKTGGERAEANHRCVCGGFLATVTSDGDLAHVDACDRCYTPGRGLPLGLCPHAGEHRFCGDPMALGAYAGCGLTRQYCCPGDCRPS